MKTVKIESNYAPLNKSELFRKIFLLQLELMDERVDHDSHYNNELNNLIQSIDRLLEAMISDPT